MKIKTFVFTLLLILTTTFASANYFRDLILTGTDGPWTDVRSYNSLTNAINAIGANKQTLLIPTEVTCSNLTIPSNVTLKFTKNGAINNSGQLTIQTKDIIADSHQIFTGSGDIDFADTTEVKASWFSSLDDAISLTNDDRVRLIIDGQYTLSSSQTLGTEVILVFPSPDSAISTNAGATLSNISNIESGKHTILTGDGDFDFVAGSTVHSSWFTSLRRGLAYIDDDNVNLTMLVDGNTDIDSDTTVDNYITLKIEKGNPINISAGVTLTINGSFEAGLYQVFNGDGDVIINNNTIKANWWYDGSDIGLALTKAISAAGSNCQYAYITLGNGSYDLTSSVDFTGKSSSVLSYTVLDLQNSYINLKVSNAPAFDCIGTAQVTVKGGILCGDATATPSSAFLLGPNSSRTNQIHWEFKDTKIQGNYTKAGIVAIGTAPLILDGEAEVVNMNGGPALSITRRNSLSESSVYDTIATLPQDSISLWIGDRVVLRGGGASYPVVQIEGESNYISFDRSYIKSNGGAAFFDFNISNDSIGPVYLEGIRGEYESEPTTAITVQGANTLDISLSGGRLPSSTDLINMANGTIKGDICCPHVTLLGTGGSLVLNDVSNLRINLRSVNTLDINGNIAGGIIAYGQGTDRNKIDVSGATNGNRIRYIDSRDNIGYASVTLSSDQNLTSSVTTTVQFDSEDEDSWNVFDTTSHEYTADVSGVYSIEAQLYLTGLTSGDVLRLYIVKNGSNEAIKYKVADATAESIMIRKNVRLSAGDTIKINVLNSTNDCTVSSAGGYTYLTITKL